MQKIKNPINVVPSIIINKDRVVKNHGILLWTARAEIFRYSSARRNGYNIECEGQGFRLCLKVL